MELVNGNLHKYATYASRLNMASGNGAPLGAITSALTATQHDLLYEYSIDWDVINISEL